MPKDFSLTDILKHINDVVIVTRADNTNLPGPENVYVNEAFMRLTGYEVSEVIGKNPRQLQDPKICNTRPHGGTGFGLAISKELIEKYHGDIGFYDNSPNVNAFYFEPPVLRSGQQAA